MFASETKRDLAEVERFLATNAPAIRLTYSIGRPHRKSLACSSIRVLGPLFDTCKDYLIEHLTIRSLPGRAIIYPFGYHTTAIAISSSFLTTWRTRPKEAEEILLHELAHYRHGDTYILGAGSFLETVSKYWLSITLVFTIIPILIALVYEDVTTLQQTLSITHAVPELRGQIIVHFLQQIVVVDLPDLLLPLLLSLFWSASHFLLLLAAIWSAELNADRFVTDTMHEMTTLIPQQGKSKQWLLDAMTHPPKGLRRWVAEPGRAGRSLFLLLFFPLAFVLLISVKIGLFLSSYNGSNLFDEAVKPLLQGIVWIELCIAFSLLLWPLFGRYWEWIFSRVKGERRDGNSYRVYLVSAICVVGLCLPGTTLSLFPTFSHSQTVGTTANATSLQTARAISSITPTATIPTDSLPISVLAHSYNGTMTPTASPTSSAAKITLSVLQQDQQGNIKGSMTIAAPLTGTGTFTGTIDSNKALQFTFTPATKKSYTTIKFLGSLKSNNIIGGIYIIPGGGQTGSWQAQPAPQ